MPHHSNSLSNERAGLLAGCQVVCTITKLIVGEVRWQLLSDLEYYFGPYYDKPQKDKLCAVFSLTTEEFDAALAAGKAADLENDKVLDRWVKHVRRLLQLVPNATAEEVATETGIPLHVSQKVLEQKNAIWSDDGYAVIFDAFGDSFEMFKFIRKHG